MLSLPEGLGSIPGWGTKIPQATWRGTAKKKKKKNVPPSPNLEDVTE